MQLRIESLQKELQQGEAVIITSPANRLYYTGFSSSAGTLFVTPEIAIFLIDFRYIEKAQKTIQHCTVLQSIQYYRQLQELIEQHNIKILYTETSKTSIEQYKTLTNMLNCEISKENRFDRYILQQRKNKTTDEVDKIKQAQKITDNTFSHILNYIKAGKSEREIMLEMEFYLRKQGSEGVSFDFIVVSGQNSSLPHGKPTEKLIENGDFITMDFGAVIGGYRSDMTRTVAVGAVSEYQKLVYNTVLEAQKQALAAIRPGAVCKDIDKIARSFIANNGFDGYFGHGLGHSVGIEVHESPSFNTVDDSVLEPGMVLTVEPGIYLPNQFGVRIEDMVLITENGFENLTNSPKELIIL